MKKYISVVLVILLCASFAFTSAQKLEQHPDKGPLPKFYNVELQCRYGPAPEILMYKMTDENGKLVDYFFAKGYLHLQEDIIDFGNYYNLNINWTYLDKQASGHFVKTC